MDMNQVPEEFLEEIEGLRHGSTNVQAYVLESIDEAENWAEAQSSIIAHMKDIISEAEGVMGDICEYSPGSESK